MATFTVTINDAKLAKLLDFYARTRPIPTTGNPPVPQYTKGQWARRQLKKDLNTNIWDQENYEAKLIVSVPRDDTNVDVT